MEVTGFKTISAPSEGMFKDRGSSFPSFCFPVSSEEETKDFIRQIKKQHPKCNHHCYAFRMKPDGSIFRSSDDREPSGSAGKPILGVLLSNELTDTLIIVARYFGGTQLGIPGLINAYRSAAEDAVKNAGIIYKTVDVVIKFAFPYSILNDVMLLLKSYSFSIKDQQYDENVLMVLQMPLNDFIKMKTELKLSSFGYLVEVMK